MLIHGVKVEGVVLAMDGFDLLVNVIFQLARCKGNVIVDGEVDEDYDKDVVGSFLSGWEVALEQNCFGGGCCERGAIKVVSFDHWVELAFFYEEDDD